MCVGSCNERSQPGNVNTTEREANDKKGTSRLRLGTRLFLTNSRHTVDGEKGGWWVVADPLTSTAITASSSYNPALHLHILPQLQPPRDASRKGRDRAAHPQKPTKSSVAYFWWCRTSANHQKPNRLGPLGMSISGPAVRVP